MHSTSQERIHRKVSGKNSNALTKTRPGGRADGAATPCEKGKTGMAPAFLAFRSWLGEVLATSWFHHNRRPTSKPGLLRCPESARGVRFDVPANFFFQSPT